MTLLLTPDGRAEGEADPLIGLRVLGDYVVLKKIGEGGMGSVYVAEDPDIGRIAIKVLVPELSRRGDVLARFIGEARAASQIGNPHIVKFIAKGTLPDGRVYLAMEYLDGSSLQAHLESWKVLALPHALALLVQAVYALTAAHKMGITHRDVKPANMFVAERAGQQLYLSVLDFGVAKFTDDRMIQGVQTHTGAVIGTPQFMSPEQAQGSPLVDHRSDIYALGLIAHLMVTGVMPQWHPDTGRWRDPRDLRPDLPEAWALAILKAIEFHPDDRPRSAREWLAPMIDATEDGEGVVAKYARGYENQADPDEKTRRQVGPPSLIPGALTPAPPQGSMIRTGVGAAPRRRGSLVAGAALLVVVAGSLLAWALTRGDDEQPARGATVATTSSDAGDQRATPIDAGAATSTPVDAAQPLALVADAAPPAADAAPAPRDAGPAPDARPKRRDDGDKPTGMGRLHVVVTPWALVELDGKRLGETPINVEVSAGRHRLRISNDDRNEKRTITIERGKTLLVERKW